MSEGQASHPQCRFNRSSLFLFNRFCLLWQSSSWINSLMWAWKLPLVLAVLQKTDDQNMYKLCITRQFILVASKMKTEGLGGQFRSHGHFLLQENLMFFSYLTKSYEFYFFILFFLHHLNNCYDIHKISSAQPGAFEYPHIRPAP